MLKKILLFFFIININVCSSAENKFQIVALVNNISITKLDLKKELIIIEILNNKSVSKNHVSIALNNLIEEKIKTIEIEKEKLKIEENLINDLYFMLIKNLKLDSSNIEKNIEKLIKEKIKTDRLWNELVAKKYAWKININIDELNKKISQSQNKEENSNIEKIREKLIIEEKNKKLSVYSNFYLNELKKKTTIKYYQ